MHVTWFEWTEFKNDKKLNVQVFNFFMYLFVCLFILIYLFIHLFIWGGGVIIIKQSFESYINNV